MCLAAEAMGTRFEWVLADARPPAQLRAAGEAAFAEVHEVEARWSRFRKDSFLAHLERTAAGEAVRLDEDDYELLDAARRAFDATGGGFDPCVVGAAGEASLGACAGWRAPAERATFADVVLDARARTVRFARRGVRLDFGGIAKGHALDRAARVLEEAGVRCALLHGGTSSVVALGAPPTIGRLHSPRADHAWLVALGPEEGAPLARLAGAALSVSAPRRRDAPHEGRDGAPMPGHVADPATGRPCEGLAAVAVALGREDDVAPAALADALATGWLARGARALEEIAGALAHERRGGERACGDRGGELARGDCGGGRADAKLPPCERATARLDGSWTFSARPRSRFVRQRARTEPPLAQPLAQPPAQPIRPPRSKGAPHR